MKGMQYGKEEATPAKLLNKHRTTEYSSNIQEDPRHDYELIVQLGDEDMNRVNVKCSQS